MKIFFALLASTIFTSPAFAKKIISGYERGNGGYYLDCSTNSRHGQGLFSFDRIEGLDYYQISPSPRLASMDNEYAILEDIFNNLEKIDAPKARLYRGWLNELLENVVINDSLHPVATLDSGYANVPPNCEIKQAAVFFSDSTQKKIKFFFDKTFVQEASALDKAYLILHEIIYREARLPQNTQLNSAPSRYLNAWLFANVDRLDASAWVESLHAAEFRDGRYSGLPLVLTYRGPAATDRKGAPIKFYPSGRLHKAILHTEFNFTFSGQVLNRHGCLVFPSVLFSGEYVEFYESGVVKKLVFDKDSSPTCPLFKGFNSLSFDESGRLLQAAATPHGLSPIFDFED